MKTVIIITDSKKFSKLLKEVDHSEICGSKKVKLVSRKAGNPASNNFAAVADQIFSELIKELSHGEDGRPKQVKKEIHEAEDPAAWMITHRIFKEFIIEPDHGEDGRPKIVKHESHEADDPDTTESAAGPYHVICMSPNEIEQGERDHPGKIKLVPPKTGKSGTPEWEAAYKRMMARLDEGDSLGGLRVERD